MMEVAVETIVARRDHGIIFSATVLTERHVDHGRRIRVRAKLTETDAVPGVGETWILEGDVKDTAYGRQVEARGVRRVMPTGALIRRFLASNVPGIGVDRAERLWAAYGDGLSEVLSDDANIQRIAEVIAPDRPLLAVRIAAATVAAWREASAEAAAMAWLDGQGVSDLAVARRVVRILGDAAVESLRANPYVLVPLLPWATVDGIGVRLLSGSGSLDHDVRRLVGAADETVKRTLGAGDTAILSDGLHASLARLLNDGSTGTIDAAVDAAERNGAVIRTEDGFRAPGAALMEDAVVRRLLEAAALGPIWPDKPPKPSRLAELVADVTAAGAPLHTQQSAAVLQVLSRPVACLTGGGGTGKTYTCKVLCDAWERLGGDVLLCALAGKAALRLSRSTRRPAMTLARTLAELAKRDRLNGIVDDPGTEEEARAAAVRQRDVLARITPTTLVLVDEASMVDLPTIHALVRRMPDGARLLLVGDGAQLPPVGFGLVFHRLVADDALTSRLTHVHRQAAATGIPAAGAAVRGRSLPAMARFEGARDGVFFVETGKGSIDAFVEEVAFELGILEGGALVVTATNEGEAGVHSLNQTFHDRHVEATGHEPMRGLLGRYFTAGVPVIFGRNDYRLGLFNGQLGRVVRTFEAETSLDVLFVDESEPRRLSGEHLLDLDLAYAVTCHKCQGSSAPRVIVPVYKSRVLDPSWLYTALTRAERQVVLIGTRKVLEDTLALPFAAERRNVGFRWPGASA